MNPDQKHCLEYLAKLGHTAEDILIDKEQIVNLSRRSNSLREAKRILQSEVKLNPDSKTWMCFGNLFIKCPKGKALSIVEKDEKLINDEINGLRNNLKPKVDNLRNLEGKPELAFNLNPLSKEELKAMKTILPNV